MEIARRFRRRGGGQAAETKRANHLPRRRRCATSIDRACIGRAVARNLLVPIEIEFVSRLRLQRETDGTDRPALGALCLSTRIGFVQKLRRIAGVLIGIDAGDGSVLALSACGEVKPQLVLSDGPAETAGHIPQLEQLAGRRQAGGFQRVAVIAAHHPAAHAGPVEGALDRIAAGLRHDTQRRAADLRFAEAAGRGERDFLRVGDVGEVG